MKGAIVLQETGKKKKKKNLLQIFIMEMTGVAGGSAGGGARSQPTAVQIHKISVKCILELATSAHQSLLTRVKMIPSHFC